MLAAASGLLKGKLRVILVAAEMEIGVGCKESLVKNCGAFECRKPDFCILPPNLLFF